MTEPALLNVVEWTVSEVSAALKRTVEDNFSHVRVRGEISGYRGPHSSGHVYFALKDEGARIDAVIWKGVFTRLRIKPEEGLEVIVTGRITSDHWTTVGPGDGMYNQVDPTDSRYVYNTREMGNHGRFDRVTGDRTVIAPPASR